MLKVNDKAPDFILYDQDKNPHSLKDYLGQKIVLYFYPKDMTSGCTLEAQGFQDLWLEFVSLGIVLFGISPDAVKSHQEFCEKESLTFPLLADVDKEVADLYGVLDSGKISRNTYIINEKGNIEKIFTKVEPSKHPNEVLEYLKNNIK